MALRTSLSRQLPAGGASPLNADEGILQISSLVVKLAALSDDAVDFDAGHSSEVLDNLCRDVSASAAAKDAFRRAKGFEAALSAMRNALAKPSSGHMLHVNFLRQWIALLSVATRDHRGNKKYFAFHLDGWAELQNIIEGLSRSNSSHAGYTSAAIHAMFALALAEDALEQYGIAGDSESTEPALFETHTFTGHEVLCNPDACAIALRLSLDVIKNNVSGQSETLSASLLFLQMVTAVVELSTRNRVALWKTGILSELLSCLLDAEIDSQAENSIERLFSALAMLGLPHLDDVAHLFDRSSSSDRARKLLLSTLQDSVWPPFVQFDLSLHGYSSIEFPSLQRSFPPPIGYTLVAWIRVDNFDSNCHTTLFGAFDASQTCFILTYLEKDSHQLILQTSIRSSRPSVRFKAVRFEVDRWYHISIVHRKNASDSSQSSAVLFVDGEFTEQVRCTYPDAPPEQRGSSSTESPTSHTAASVRRLNPIQAFFGTPHDLGLKYGRNEVMSRWSLARAHLYQTPLTDEFVAVHHRIGPRYVGNLQDCLGPLLTYRASAELNRYNELLHPDRSEKSDIVTATEKRGSEVAPESRLLISVFPSAVISFDDHSNRKDSLKLDLDRKAAMRYQQLTQKAKAIAINASIPTLNEAISRSYGNGILTGEPVVAVPKALDDGSWCLIGSLPILIRLLESASDRTSFLQAVQIFFECMVDNWRISEAMEKGNGFGILAVVIREKLGIETIASLATTRKPATPLSLEDRQNLSHELLQLILEFVGHDKKTPEESIIVNPMAYRLLLIDFDTWRRCDANTQKLYYTQFTHFVTRNKHRTFNQKRLVRMRVVKKLIEALKSEECSPETVPSMMEALKALLDTVSASPMFRELAMFVSYGLQDDRTLAQKPMKSMASVVSVRTKTAALVKAIRGSRPATPSGSQTPTLPGATRTELAINVLQLLESIVREDRSAIALRRFNKAVPNRWLLHLLAETDERVVTLAMKILARALTTLGNDFKGPFIEKNGGFITLKSRLKTFWKSATVWLCCFSMMFGILLPAEAPPQDFGLFTLINLFAVNDSLTVENPEVLPVIMALLEAGLRHVISQDSAGDKDIEILRTVVMFLSELYGRSPNFREFAATSRYVQEILFILFPVLVGSDRLSADLELQSDTESLSFNGEEVKMRPHSNSLGARPPSVRSLSMNSDHRTPSPGATKRIEAPRKMSAFVLINPEDDKSLAPPAQFNPVMAPKKVEPVKINVGNSIVESLLEVAVGLFLDLICNKDKFNGIGLFLKVPPGFREHQAYFQSYVMIHTLNQLWNHLQLNQSLLLETKVLTNLNRFCQHMSEAVFEGWFIDGSQPFLDFSGKLLEYLQQPEVAIVKSVRLCSQNINNIRIVFLRVCLARLSELDESTDEQEVISFLDKMNYWQTILFASENQETLFIRLMCFLLYTKLVSDTPAVRLAAARIWRTMLVHKPTETATLLAYAAGSEQRHLSTGFMALVSMDDADFLSWVDDNRSSLDSIFIDTLKKQWTEFVAEENRRTEESANSRLEKRHEKLRQWRTEEVSADEFLNRYEVSTSHWRSNVHAQERLKLQRGIQDHQESINHLMTVFSGLESQLKQACGVSPSMERSQWQLDETEAVNRMRLRTVPDTSDQTQAFQPKQKARERRHTNLPMINTDLGKDLRENIMSAVPATPLTARDDGENETPEGTRSRSASASNAQLLEGEFEMVEDPREADDGLIEDKNRKVMMSLQRGDMVQQLYNVSRIVGLEACEGLIVVGKKCLYLQDNFFQRSDGEIVSVSQAPEDERDPYVQLISGKDVGTNRSKHSIGDNEARHWTWNEVLSISKRRFLFRDVSVEVFFTDGRSYLLTCISGKVRDDLYNAVVLRAPHVHSSTSLASEDAWRLDTLRNPEEIPQSIGSKFANVFNNGPSNTSTRRWCKGEMSNFQYLMLVNTLAGRTFNDLTQYPVFPWVLADYTSDELDLNDPNSFRDFSRPMGCQTKSRAAEYRSRYKQFEEMADHNAPPFHYGTHYSSAMIVSSYLIRLQPFVQSYLLLQGGAFDHADRLFDSVEKAWLSASKDNMSDVRELTPEFFYLPEFLTNINGYEFGMKQAGNEAVNDVKLPPWAKGDPFVFVSKHREALESPYVSEHLHKWIDLIFGFKQRGEAAVEATNVFGHLSYQGARDLDTIDDPVERLASIGIIHSFGQTPHQVFQKAHPPREMDRSTIPKLDQLAETLTRLPDPIFTSEEKVADLVFSRTQERLHYTGPCKINMLPHCDRYLEWDFADNSVRFFSSHTRRLLGLYENTHVGPVAAATLVDSKTLVTAGADCTIGIWGVSASRDLIMIQPKTYLFGHRAAVTVLAASRMFSTLLSASLDGHVLIWSLNRHQCIRVLHPSGSPSIQAARISNVSGHIMLCQGAHILLYSLNGHLLVKQKVCDSPDDQLICGAFYEGAGNEWVGRELLFTGHTHGVANVWALTTLVDGSWHLQLVKRLNHTDMRSEDGANYLAAVTAILPMAHAVYTGDEDGRVWEWDCVQRNASIGGKGR